MRNIHVHVHGALDQEPNRLHHVGDSGSDSYRRDQQGRFATSSGTGEQHAATSELHTAIAARKGTDHKDHAHHVAAAEAHKQAATFLAQANKAQHPGAAIEAERHAKNARAHENFINKGRGSDPKGETARQTKAMSDPKTAAGNKERMEELDKKFPQKGGAKKPAAKKTKDAACGCEHKDTGMGLSKQTLDSLAIVRAYVGDDWAEWNKTHGRTRVHSNENSAHKDITSRRESLVAHGFKHTHNYAHETEGVTHHYSHPEGHKAMVHHVGKQGAKITVKSHVTPKK